MKFETDPKIAYLKARKICETKWETLEKEASEYYSSDCDYDWNVLSPERKEYFTKGVMAGVVGSQVKGLLYNKFTLIEFTANTIWKMNNPDSDMECPNSLYIKIEQMLDEWNKEQH